jgi:xylulokinase
MDTQPEFRRLSGNIVFSGFTAPKLEWLRAHEPDIHARAAKVLLPAAYLNLYLTGEHVCDMSDASGTAWLDLAARAWSAPLLQGGQMTADQMPKLVEGSAPAGLVRADLAARWGIRTPVAVAGGAGYNAAAACGLGAMDEGAGFVSFGTSGVLLMARRGCHPAPETALHTFCHAVPERWYQMGVMLAATDCLNWLSTITGVPPQSLTTALGDQIAAPGPVQFYPYLSGERTPHNDAAIRGGFCGLDIATTRDDLTRAVLEGVCFGLRDTLEALKQTGGTFTRLYAIGGGSASRYWLSLLATVLNIPLHIPDGREFGAALGAARLGRAAATDTPPKQIMAAAPTSEIIAPVAALTDAFDARYALFRTGYGTLDALQNGRRV